MVTAKHVIQDAKGQFYPRIYVRLNKKEGDAQYISLDLTRDGHSIVSTNQDPTVDIAVIPAMPSHEVFSVKMIPDEMLTTEAYFKELNIAEGSDVFFTGLFVGYYGEHRNNPIVRFGRVAMLPEDRISWRPDATKPAENARLYLLETQSYGGNSGSPVFFFLGSDRTPGSLVLGPPLIKLAGIMKGSFNALSPVGIMQTPNATVPFSSQNIGIAAVTPSYLLHEILFSDEMKKVRTDHAEPKK